MALAQIIDLAERRRARTSRVPVATELVTTALPPVWCCVWMPVYYWYVA